MVVLIILLGLLVLIAPVMAVIALVSASSMQQTVRNLESRLRTLERCSTAAPPPPQAAPQPTARLEETASAITPPATFECSESTASNQAPPPAPTAVPLSPTAAEPPVGFEERVGTRWVVWIGGIALALGGIFLVRYTIEQGLIGPHVRILLGTLLALTLVVAGEWQRRSEILSGIAGLPAANIPSVLTAAGTAVAYATVYAAYALYGILPPPAAFILLGVVAL